MRATVAIFAGVAVLQAAVVVYVLQDHERQLDALTASARTRLAGLVDRVDDLEADVRSIEPPAPPPVAAEPSLPDPALSADVEALRRDVEVFAADLDKLEGQVGTDLGVLAGRVAALDDAIGGPPPIGPPIEARVGELEDDVDFLRDCVDEITFKWESANAPLCLDLTP